MDYLITAIILLIIGGAVLYIHREKKKGTHCIGCPHSKECGGKCHCGDNGDNGENE